MFFVAPIAISRGLPSHYPPSYGETNRIVERGVQAIHALNGKDRQIIHQDAGPNELCSSQSVIMSFNLLRSNGNSNDGNIVSGDTATSGVMAAPAGFPVRDLHESKVCSPKPRAQFFRLGDLGKSTSRENAVGRRGNVNPGAGRAELSQHQSAPDMGSRERGIACRAGVLAKRPSTEVTTVASTVAPSQGVIKRQALRIGDGRSVEVAPSHGGVPGFPIGYEPCGRRIGERAPLQKPSVNCRAAPRNGAEHRVCDDAAAAAAITTAEVTKRARTSGGDFRELEQKIRLGGVPRFTVAGLPGPGQHD